MRLLKNVKQLYDAHKHAPPLVRNQPTVAGNIQYATRHHIPREMVSHTTDLVRWARSLMTRIEEPMRTFKQDRTVAFMPEWLKVIKEYYRVAKVVHAQLELVCARACMRAAEPCG